MNNQQQESDDKQPSKMPNNLLHTLMTVFLITFLINLIFGSLTATSKLQISYSEFIKLVEAECVERVTIETEQLQITLRADAALEAVEGILNVNGDAKLSERLKNNKLYYTGRVEDPELVNRLLNKNVYVDKPIVRSTPILSFIASWIIPILLIYLLYTFFIRSMVKRMGGSNGIGGFMNVGKSKAKVFNLEKSTGVSFADVAGQDEAKESLTEIVDILHAPDKYNKIGAKQPRGALLVGPPGTGKTLLAKAVAGEANVPFFSLSGSEFVEMFVGVGASRVRDLFEQANKQAPCIVFIDEIDAIGKSRNNQMGGNDEREQTLNQLLAEMDGFDSSKGIVVLAATNRPEVLDKALLRPGRFDRRIIVEKPDLPGRESILKVHAAKVRMAGDVNLKEIALMTSGAAGADLANMVNEAALRAVRLGRDTVNQADLMEAVEVVIAGKEKKDRILNLKERRMVAFHEVGHALATALQKDGVPVQKITIVPRMMGSLGYTMNMPEEERYLMTENELLTQITTLLAGRAAEEIEFQEISTGASNDIERATKIARSMVTQYGMSERFGLMGLESVQDRYLDGRNVATCSEATGASIDEEVRKIIQNCYDNAVALLQSKRQKLREIAEFLIEKETITGGQFMEILHKAE